MYKNVPLRKVEVGDEAFYNGKWYSVVDVDWGQASLLDNDTADTLEINMTELDKARRWEG